nr:DUF547 domain-containing protein [Gemmatimonadaceae bacterium]
MTTRLRARHALAVATIAVLALAIPAAAQDKRADHRDFDALLRTHVVNGLVDYDAFESAPEFRRYLAMLAAVDPAGLPAQELLAFWINAYNAYTIQLINQHHERRSIRNINRSFGLRLKGPWKERLAVVGGRDYSLDEIEHEVIRKKFREPRIHFALVCAALGCPVLRGEAYRGDRIDQQLDDQAHRFLLESPTKNRVDVTSRTLHASPIFNWYI